MNENNESELLDDPKFQSLLVSCLEAIERGEAPDVRQLRDEYPKYADALGAFLGDHDQLRKAVGSKHDPNATVGLDETRDGPEVGERLRYIGEYEILDEIARGGMGVVFKARQERLKRVVALKMILAGKLANEADVQRFQREAQAAGQLQHPNIVAIHEVGDYHGHQYFTMEFVDGSSLADVLREETLEPRRAAEIVKTVAEAIQYAHDKGTLHRDLKPANVIMDASGQPHVTDFGLAKVLAEGDESRSELTDTGQVLGTPSYMSPEQAAGKQALVGPASDVYALGAVLYACLTGRGPFVADSPMATLMQVLHKDAVSPRMLNPKVPKDLETICLKCLRKEPHKRYGTAGELAEDLGRFLEGRAVKARPVSSPARAWRWAKRNPTVATLLVLIAMLLVTGAGISSLLAVRANQAKRHALNSERRARIEAGNAILAREHALEQAEIATTNLRLAREQERRAEGLRLAGLSRAEIHTDPGLALLLAIESARDRSRLPAHNEALLDALLKCREKRTLSGYERPVTLINYDPQGHLLFTSVRSSNTTSPNTAPQIWKPSTSEMITTLPQLGVVGVSAVFSPDGSRLVTTYNGSSEAKYVRRDSNGRPVEMSTCVHTDRVARVWDVATGKEVCILRGHTGAVLSAAFSLDGARIVTASRDGTAQVWDATSGEPLRTLAVGEASVLRAWFLPDNRVLSFSAGTELSQRLSQWKDRPINPPADPGPGWGYAGPGGGSWGTQHGPPTPQKTLAKIWDVESGEVVREFSITSSRPKGAVARSAIVSRVGKLLAASLDPVFGEEKATAVWDLTTEELLQDLYAHNEPIRFLDFNQDGSRLLAAGENRLTSWNPRTGEELAHVSVPEARIHSARFLWDGRVVTGHSDGIVRVWQLEGTRAVEELKGHELAVTAVIPNPQGKTLATASEDGTVRIWDITDRFSSIRVLKGHENQPFVLEKSVTNARFSPDSRHVITAGVDGTARVWDVRTGRERSRFRIRAFGGRTDVDRGYPHSRQVLFYEARFSPNGEQILTACDEAQVRVRSADGTLTPKPYTAARVHDARTGELLFGLPHQCGVRVATYSPDGTRILTATRGKGTYLQIGKRGGGGGDLVIKETYAHIWDASTGSRLTTLGGHKGDIFCAIFSPDGHRVVTADRHALRLWNAQSGELLAERSEETFHNVFSVAFSPNGRWLVPCSAEKLFATGVPILDAFTLEEVRRLDGHQMVVNLAVFSAHNRLLTISADHTARLWHVETGKELAVLRGHQKMPGTLGGRTSPPDLLAPYFRGIHHAAFSDDGLRIVTAGSDRTARIWDAMTGDPWMTLRGHTGPIYSARFSPDGKWVATASADGTARVWPVDPLPVAQARVPRELTEAEKRHYEIDGGRE